MIATFKLCIIQKKYRTFVVDKPIKFSELLKTNLLSEDIAQAMCDKANDLHKTYEQYIEFKHKKKNKKSTQ